VDKTLVYFGRPLIRPLPSATSAQLGLLVWLSNPKNKRKSEKKKLKKKLKIQGPGQIRRQIQPSRTIRADFDPKHVEPFAQPYLPDLGT
jgi:hypothetical protein